MYCVNISDTNETNGLHFQTKQNAQRQELKEPRIQAPSTIRSDLSTKEMCQSQSEVKSMVAAVQDACKSKINKPATTITHVESESQGGIMMKVAHLSTQQPAL